MQTTTEPPRIGGTERFGPSSRYGNNQGLCVVEGCTKSVRRLKGKWLGKFCEHHRDRISRTGSLTTPLPKITHPHIWPIYTAAKGVVITAIKAQYSGAAKAATTIELAATRQHWEGMGDPAALPRKSPSWAYLYYLNHLLAVRGDVGTVVHVMAVVAVAQLVKWETEMQRDQFIVTRGMAGPRGLPRRGIDREGKPKPHHAFGTKMARTLAKRITADFRMDFTMLTEVQRIVEENS